MKQIKYLILLLVIGMIACNGPEEPGKKTYTINEIEKNINDFQLYADSTKISFFVYVLEINGRDQAFLPSQLGNPDTLTLISRYGEAYKGKQNRVMDQPIRYIDWWSFFINDTHNKTIAVRDSLDKQ